MSRIQGVFAGARAVLPQAVLEPLARRMPRYEGGRHAVRDSGTAVLAWAGAAGGGVAADDRFVVALDGRFYNAAELDRRLGSTGMRPHGDRSDADRLLELLRRYGLHEALPLLNGDFAIAVHDRQEETFWLVRDRFGLKPLYYAPTSHGLFFASLPMPLAGMLGRQTVNPRFAAVFAGSHYRYFDNAAEESPFVGVFQVPRASVVTIRADMSIGTKRWWSLTDAPDWTSPPEELAERYRELLMDSVGLRLSATRRPAFTLSGGMDSSTVLSCAARVTGAGQTAFSAVYRDPTYDERADIGPMLGDRVEHWIPVAVDDVDVFSLVQRMVRIHGEPVATATWLSHFQLCGAVAAAGHDALFGGMGGDELNVGEYEYFPYFFADLLVSGREADFEQEIEAWIGHHDHPVFRKTRDVALAAVRDLTDSQNRGFNRLDRRRMNRYAMAVLPDWFDLNQFVPVMEHPFRSHLRNRTWQDMTLETAPCCLRAEDRHTTFWGLERIDPFYDHRLAEFLFRVPIDQQIVQGVTKGLLRRATTGILPDETRQRVRKTGWNAPAHLWFSEGRPAEQMDDLIASRRFRERGLYDVRVVERLLDDHRAVVASGEARENHMMFFWQLLNLELWLQAVEEDDWDDSGTGAGRSGGGACVGLS